MNWVGGVRRRVILKEEERRRQEQFFAAHASSKIRNSGRKTKDKAEREKVNAKAMVLGKSRPNCHPWKNEQVISHCVQLGVPPSNLKHQEGSSGFLPGILASGRNRNEEQGPQGAAASGVFSGKHSCKKIHPASIHCPFSKYLLQLEVQGIENKLKEQNMRRTEMKMLNKSIKGLTELNPSSGKEERDKDKKQKEENAGKKRTVQDISIQENIDHSFPCQRKKNENQIVMDDKNIQKHLSKVKFNETETLNEKIRPSGKGERSFIQKLDSNKHMNHDTKKRGGGMSSLKTACLKNGSRKIYKHGYMCSKKDKSLSIEACRKDKGKEDFHIKLKHNASSRSANGGRGSKLDSTEKKIMSKVKRKEQSPLPRWLNGAPRLRRILTLSPASHKGRIWVPLKLSHQDIYTNSSGRAVNQDGHDDKEPGKASHFKTIDNENIQSHENNCNYKSVLSQEVQEKHRTSDKNNHEDNRLKMLIGKCTKLLPEELSHSAESSIEVSKQIQKCNPTLDKQEKHQESLKLHPRLITYVTDENDKRFSEKERTPDNEDFYACTRKNQMRELHYIYKDTTILSAEEPQKTSTPTKGRLRLSDFTRKVYEVESGLSFARNRKDKTPYLDKSIPTPWRSQTSTQTPGGSSGKSSSRTPTDPVFDRSLEDPFETHGDSEACEVTEGNLSIVKSQQKATCEAAHDIPPNSENVYVTGTNLESGVHMIILNSLSDRRQCDIISTDARQQNMPGNDDERKGETEICCAHTISLMEVPQSTRIYRKLNQLDKKDGNILYKNGEQRNSSDDQSNLLTASSRSSEYLYEVKRKEASQEKASEMFFHYPEKLAKSPNKLKDYPSPDFALDSTQGMVEHLFFNIKTNHGLFSDSDISASQEEIKKLRAI
nr:uncharacterized protein LOC113800080 [Penaeus vannamei]